MSTASCRYKPRTMLWALVNEDFSDLTVKQIAEVFGTSAHHVYVSIKRIEEQTGYKVPYIRVRQKECPNHTAEA